MNGNDQQRSTARYVLWKVDSAWLGYLDEFPDYWTQGSTLEDLQIHLRDLYEDLASDSDSQHAPGG